MILDELIVHNFGVFRGRHTITFTPPSRTKPVVLIGGLNGGGKTTILDALQLALYGPLARLARRRGGSYDAYLRQAIHHGIPSSEGAAVQLSFHAHQEGVAHHYRVERTWHVERDRLRERLEVLKDGRLDRALTDNWADHVEAFVPRGVAALFFFDGEQIETFADLENSRELLGTALGALLGLDLTDRLAADLTVLERRHRTKQIPADNRADIDERRLRVAHLRQEEERAAQIVGSARVRVERAEKHLHTVEEQYRLEGGELYEQRARLDAQRQAAEDDLTRLNADLHEVAASAAPLLLVLPQLRDVVVAGDDELRANQQRLLLGALTARDALLLETLRGTRTAQGTLHTIERFLDDDRSERAGLAHRAPVLDADKEAIDVARSLADMVLPAIREQLRAALDQHQAARHRLDEADRRLTAVPSADALSRILDERNGAISRLASVQAAWDQAEANLATARTARAQADQDYERALDLAARATIAASESGRLIDHSARVRNTLATFRTEATRRHLGRIESLVLDSLRRLLRKEALITDLQIDPTTYAVELRSRDSQPIAPHQLSAGERQLLAVSLLWGLARASGQPLPVVIDTPLGRLDGTHRHHLVERYFPHASHQVVLLSTDKEIDAGAWEQLRPRVGHAYRLDYDERTGATTINPGYFW